MKFRESIGYDKTRFGITEYTKTKPITNIKGKVTLQLINDETKEVEREVFTENVRMKYLDHQIYADGLVGASCLWDLVVKYSGYSTSYGKQLEQGGKFKYLGLFNSVEEQEDERKPCVSGSLLGYSGFATTYSGDSAQQGSWNKTESYIKGDTEGNLVMHQVYDFATNACNGNITHIGYLRNTGSYSYKNTVIYGNGFEAFNGLPSLLLPSYSSVVQKCSSNCFETGKNTFLFILEEKSSYNFKLIELNVFTGEVVRNIQLTGVDGTAFKPSGVRNFQISKDGSTAYAVVYVDTTSEYAVLGATKKGWNVISFSTETGKVTNNIEIGQITIPGGSSQYSGYSVATIDIHETGNLIILGGASSSYAWHMTEIKLGDLSVVKEKSVLTGSDSDSSTSGDVYRGTLYLQENGELIYRRDHKDDTKSHLIFDREFNIIRRQKDIKDKITIAMNIIGHEHLAVGTVGTNTANYTYWGIFDRSETHAVSTLTKLSSPVLKTSNYTMKVQYDIIFEVPNIMEGFVDGGN